jgi:hypothetical protein
MSDRITANLNDAHDRRGREAQHKVAPKAQHLRPFSRLGHVEMGDEKIRVRRLEHADLDGRVRLKVGHKRPNSTIVVGRNMLIGGLLKVIVQRPDGCGRC